MIRGECAFVVSDESGALSGSRRDITIPSDQLGRLSLQLKYGLFWQADSVARLIIYWQNDPIATLGKNREYHFSPADLDPKQINSVRLSALREDFELQLARATAARASLTIRFAHFSAVNPEALFDGPSHLDIDSSEINLLRVQETFLPLPSTGTWFVPNGIYLTGDDPSSLELTFKGRRIAHLGPHYQSELVRGMRFCDLQKLLRQQLAEAVHKALASGRQLSVNFSAWENFPEAKLFELGEWVTN